MLLEGTRVVELATLIAGPFCGLTLADLGASVVKVEWGRGDESRTFPPFADDGESAFFHMMNRGKQLERVETLEDAREFAEGADVVIENLGDARDRVGFGQDPQRIWCSVTGYGAARGGRAMDPSIQAAMGFMELTGDADGAPQRVPVPLMDFMTGMYAAQNVITALWERERGSGGRHIDCALVDSAATFTSSVALLSLGGFLDPTRIGSESYLRVPSAVFEASDGRYVQVVALHDRHWEGICRALEREEWLDDERFATNDRRLDHRKEVHEAVAEVICTGPADDWVERINAAGGMAERLRTLSEAWRDPLLRERGLLIDADGFDFPLPRASLARDPAASPGSRS